MSKIEDRDAEIIRRYKAGEAQQTIGEALGFKSRTIVADAIKRYETATGETLGRHPSTGRNAAKRRFVNKVEWTAHAADVVERYRSGATMQAIAKFFDCRHGSIVSIIKRFERRTGERVLPPPRPRDPGHRYAPRSTNAPPQRNSQFAQPAAAISIAGIVPLDEMLRIIARNRHDPAREAIVLDACKAAAPYIHARLAPIEHTGKLSLEQVIERLTKEQLAEFAATLRASLAADEDRGGAEGAGALDAAARTTGTRLQ